MKRSNRSKFVLDIDRLMLVVAFLHPLMAFPQVYHIYSTQSAEDVSLLTWILFTIMGFVFLTYASVHKIVPHIITQLIWFFMDAVIITGIILYS